MASNKSGNPAAAAPVERPALAARLASEVFGTFFLVFGVIGTALFAAGFKDGEENLLGVGFLGVSLAVGLTVIGGAYAVGAISGAHFNPAVTVGLATAGRFAWKDVPGYIGAQIIGGLIATSILFAIASNGPKGYLDGLIGGGFASNGFGEHSPAGFGIGAALIAEIVFTAIFVWVILGVTSKNAPAGFAGIAIGLTLTLIHLASIPIDNTSVNPARSIATAVYGGGEALGQLWVFIVAPIVGAIIAGATFKLLFEKTIKA